MSIEMKTINLDDPPSRQGVAVHNCGGDAGIVTPVAVRTRATAEFETRRVHRDSRERSLFPSHPEYKTDISQK
jgi:hypothetical protein